MVTLSATASFDSPLSTPARPRRVREDVDRIMRSAIELGEKALGADDAAGEDYVLAGETRPRTLVTSGGLLVVLRGVNTNPGEDPEDMVSVRLWLEPNRVITTRRRRLLSVIDIAEALERSGGNLSEGAGENAFLVIDGEIWTPPISS